MSQGALAIAEIIKRLHPEIPVILGGLSATYYHEEILRQYPFIDFVVRGDSTEKPLLQLLQAIKGEEGFSKYSQPHLSGRRKRNSGQSPHLCPGKPQ